MADLKISALTASTTPLAGTEVLPIVQSSTTKKVSVADLTAGRSVSMGDATLSTGNLNFSSTGQRITGDFSNATLINRLSFQSTTVNGNTRIPIIPNGTATTSELVVFNNSTPTNSQGLAFFASSTQTSIRSNGYGTGTSGYLPLSFYTGGNENLTIDTSGNATLSIGNLVIGTSGKGIDFSATPGTGTSELLSDYEEGTWTPTQGAGLSVGGTFSSSGTYTKVGREVTVYGSLTGSTSMAAAGGNVLTAGLPFTPGFPGFGGASNAFIGAGSVITNSGADVYSISAIANAGGTIYFSLNYRV
jgi:hypothetical protein